LLYMCIDIHKFGVRARRGKVTVSRVSCGVILNLSGVVFRKESIGTHMCAFMTALLLVSRLVSMLCVLKLPGFIPIAAVSAALVDEN
jgi:hypothetical protein